MEVKVNGVVYESQPEQDDLCAGCDAFSDEKLCLSISENVSCRNVIWVEKESVNNFKEKESIMQKKEIDKSKKYKTVKGIDVELVYDNYREGMEYLWVSLPKDEDKFVFATNKYGVNSMTGVYKGVYNLVEFNPLEELSNTPVDTLVKITEKSNGDTELHYLSSVDLENNGVHLFLGGCTSRTTTDIFFYSEEDYTFEIIK